jgi:hypothetical protein
MLLAIGGVCFLAIALAAHALPLGLLEPEAWSSRLGPISIIVAAAGVLGAVLLVLALVEGAAPQPRPTLPLVAVLPGPDSRPLGEEPSGDQATVGGLRVDERPERWTITDVAGEIARQLRGTQRSVHHEGVRIEVQWEGPALALHRCELVEAGPRLLRHSDSIETASARSRQVDGVVTWDGRGQRRPATRLAHDYRSSTHNAVHRAVDAALESAAWRRQG